MTVQTRSMTKNMNQLPKNQLPKNLKKINHYKWVKENNMLFTEPQIEQMGLNTDDDRKVIRDALVYGYDDDDDYDYKYEKKYAIAPEGYYWKEDLFEDLEHIDETIKSAVIKGRLDLDFYRDAMCQCFLLAKI